MSSPNLKKGRKPLLTSDPCPIGCPNIPGVAVHLVSDHVEEKARQCTKCACVAQDVHAKTPSDTTNA